MNPETWAAVDRYLAGHGGTRTTGPIAGIDAVLSARCDRPPGHLVAGGVTKDSARRKFPAAPIDFSRPDGASMPPTLRFYTETVY